MRKLDEGAEAVVYSSVWHGMPAVVKHRVEKPYRERQLDLSLRTERTKREISLIVKARQAGVLCPVVFDVEPFKIMMSRLEGRMFHNEKKPDRKLIKAAAALLAKLHSADIIHGDFTPANLMIVHEEKDEKTKNRKTQLAVIDFGLGYFSTRAEDKAIDVLTMKKALHSTWPDFGLSELFVNEYAKHGAEAEAVANRIKTIEKRVRYAQR